MRPEHLRILYIEPFDGGSHAHFTRVLTTGVFADWTVVTLPGRHWKWRMRGSAAFLALTRHAHLTQPHDLLVASAYLPLAELVGLCPELARLPKLLYFHENQLAYPARGEPPERDLHYGMTQIVSALAADRCVFNSTYNRDSFLELGDALLARMPDAVPPSWRARVEAKCLVLGVPLALESQPVAASAVPPDAPILLWNHRWEHDKDPESFFAAIDELERRGLPFRLMVLGQRYERVPAIFAQAQERHAGRIVAWGFQAQRDDYLALLQRADIAVSTARHEFFGVSMLEATHQGAYPLVPDRLSYPEIFPAEFRYAEGQLADRLEHLCRNRSADHPLRADRRHLTRPFLADQLLPAYRQTFDDLIAEWSRKAGGA